MTATLNPPKNQFQGDCSNCFGLCCVALPFSQSADFSFDKIGGVPCPNLQADYRCGIHQILRESGHRGCASYDCFGAGQKVSMVLYKGRDWQSNEMIRQEMFHVFPIIQQLHEMLNYLNEALQRRDTESLHKELGVAYEKTNKLTYLSPKEIMEIDVINHRASVNELLVKVSNLVRGNYSRDVKLPNKKLGSRIELIGSNLKGSNLRGANLRGALLIASDLREADLRNVDFIGADLRDVDLSGANLLDCIFLTQAQINAAKGDKSTKLPSTLHFPEHWNESR